MRIAVTGASGHVGANLCRLLLSHGFDVKAFIHKESKSLQALNLEFVYGDISDEKALEKLCDSCEVVFHLAAFISIRKHEAACEEVNFRSCRKLITDAKLKGIRRIIHFSSIHAYSQFPLNEVLDENRRLDIKSSVAYDKSKAKSQQWMLASSCENLEIVVINPTAIIGPFDYKPSLLGNALIRFYKGQNPGLIKGGYNWVDVRDVCEAAIGAVKKGKPGECYLTGGEWHSLQVLAEEIEKLGGHKAPHLVLPLWIARAGIPFLNIKAKLNNKTPLYTTVSLETLKNSHKNISSEKAKTVLGFKNRPFKETLSDTINWFGNNKYL